MSRFHEQAREARDDGLGLLDELPPGDPHDRQTARLELGVPGAVALERGAGPVEGEAVDLDDNALRRPQGVDFVRADADVRLWLWQVRLVDEGEEAGFGLRTRQALNRAAREDFAESRYATTALGALNGGDEGRVGGEAADLRFLDGPRKLVRQRRGRQIQQGSGRRSRREPVGAVDVCRLERFGGVDVDAGLGSG